MPDIPYEVVEDARGVRVIRGADIIGWTWEARHAESFARELNALQSRVARLEAVEKAAQEVLEANEAIPIPTLSGPWGVRVWESFQGLIAALEATDDE